MRVRHLRDALPIHPQTRTIRRWRRVCAHRSSCRRGAQSKGQWCHLGAGALYRQGRERGGGRGVGASSAAAMRPWQREAFRSRWAPQSLAIRNGFPLFLFEIFREAQILVQSRCVHVFLVPCTVSVGFVYNYREMGWYLGEGFVCMCVRALSLVTARTYERAGLACVCMYLLNYSTAIHTAVHVRSMV